MVNYLIKYLVFKMDNNEDVEDEVMNSYIEFSYEEDDNLTLSQGKIVDENISTPNVDKKKSIKKS